MIEQILKKDTIRRIWLNANARECVTSHPVLLLAFIAAIEDGVAGSTGLCDVILVTVCTAETLARRRVNVREKALHDAFFS